MKIVKNPQPKSSFLSMEKDMNLIANMLFKNPRLRKLLYETSPDCMDRPAPSEDAAIDMFGKNIKLVPKLYVDNSVLNYIVVSFDNFMPNATNPEFRDNVVEFDVICHFDQWTMKDFQLRPYKIAAEIDSMFNNQHLTGIGTLQFIGASQIILTDEYAGLCLLYSAIHGEEDKIDMLNPKDQEQFEKDFEELFS